MSRRSKARFVYISIWKCFEKKKTFNLRQYLHYFKQFCYDIVLKIFLVGLYQPQVCMRPYCQLVPLLLLNLRSKLYQLRNICYC